MTKQMISAEELARFIASEMQKHPACASALRPNVFWHEEHEGCNWDVEVVSDSSVDAEACDDCINDVVQALRAKYNLVKA